MLKPTQVSPIPLVVFTRDSASLPHPPPRERAFPILSTSATAIVIGTWQKTGVNKYYDEKVRQ